MTMERRAYEGQGLWVQISHRFGPRMMEWFMAAHMAMFGFVLLVADGLFLHPTWAGFRGLFPSAPPAEIQHWMGVLMVFAGLARFGGLIVNGARKHVTPRIRQVSAGVGCLIWFGITYGFAPSDVISTWLAIYPLFGVGELVNIVLPATKERRGMEKLFELPPLAMVVFGVTLALIFAVRYLGLWQGQNTPPPVGTEAGRILGAVIDSKKADELIASFGRLGTRLAENTRALDANTAAVGSAEREIDEARTDIRELNREIAKSGK